MGFTADIDIVGGGAGSSLSVNGGKTDINADYKAVGEQSGIFTGDGGFDLTTEGKTTLIGGAITTTDAALAAGRNNYISKGGITTQDIENMTNYEGDAISVGVSLGNTTGKPQATMNGLGYGTYSDSDSSTTKAGITGIAGNSGITTDNQAEYAGALDNVFNANRVNEELGAQTQITKEFGKEAPKAVAEFSQNRIDAIKANPNLSIDEKLAAIAKWDEGGIYRVAAHTALGALGTGSVEGALTTGSVAAAAPTLNDVQEKIAKALVDKGMSEDIASGTASGMVSLTLLGAGSVAGLDTSSTVTATNVDANNRQLHPQEQQLAKVLYEKAKKEKWKRADGKPYTLQEIEDALRWANSTKYGEKYNDDVTIRVGNRAKGAAIDKVMYDSGIGASFDSRLWKQTTSTKDTVTFTQNFDNIKKPDTNLINFIKGQTKSYGYSWTDGIVQPYTGKVAGPTPGSAKPTTTAKRVTQKQLDAQNEATLNNKGSVLPGALPAYQQQQNQETFDNLVTVVEVAGLVTGAGEAVIIIKGVGSYVVKKAALNASKKGKTSVDELVKVSKPYMGSISNSQRGAVGNLSPKKPVQPLEVGSYKELKNRAVVGDNLEHDHIPSFAALKKAKENELGRKLTPSENKDLYNNATTVEVPKDIHAAGRTYKGNNTSSQIAKDAEDLCKAQNCDLETHRQNLLNEGFSEEKINKFMSEVIERNKELEIK